MSTDLQLKSSCSGCGSTTDLYGSNCKHMTLCLSCGKTMAENRSKCVDCGVTITRLIRVRFVLPFAVIEFAYFDFIRCILSWRGQIFHLVLCDRNTMFVQILPMTRTTLLEGSCPVYQIFRRRKVLRTSGLCRRKDCTVAKLLILCGYWNLPLLRSYFLPCMVFSYKEWFKAPHF